MPAPLRDYLAGLESVGTPASDFASIVAVPEQVVAGSLFVALRELPAYDGHQHLDEAAQRGAAALLIEQRELELLGELPLPAYLSASTTTAWGALARLRRQQLPYPIVAITGSAGKTSTKELLAAALTAPCTEGNRNNLHGAPYTLLHLPPQATAGIVELGTSLPGEIGRLAQIAQPDVALLTNVGPTHLAGLGDLDGVEREKGALFDGLAAAGIAVGNHDDARVMRQLQRWGGRRLSFSAEGAAEADVAVEELLELSPAGSRARVRVGKERHELRLATPGLHLLANAAAALTVVLALEADVEAAISRMADVRLPPGRFQVLRLGGRVLIDDSYNSNPQAVRSAVQSLRGMADGAPAHVCLGDMAELGAGELAMHRALGAWLAASGIASLHSCGPLMAHAVAEAAAAGLADAQAWPDRGALAEALAERVPPGALLLVKGSRSAGMEQVVAALRRSWAPDPEAGSRWFSRAEISCQCGCGYCVPRPEFLELLDALREQVGQPLLVSSFCRCPTHNRRVGGIPESAHVKGMAVDLFCSDDQLRLKLVGGWFRLVHARNSARAAAGQALIPLRVELGYDYVHFDIDPDQAEMLFYNVENFRAYLG